jgi:phage-related protein
VKAAIFHPAALTAIRSFPADVRRELGKTITDLQKGAILAMPVSRPMPSIAPGASELRIGDRSGIYRAFYYSQSTKGILVFHAFVKKTQATPNAELNLGKKRLKELLHEEV